MELSADDLGDLEPELEQNAPWMHKYRFSQAAVVGYFKYHGIAETVATRNSDPALQKRMNAAFEDYMGTEPYAPLDDALARCGGVRGASILDIGSATGKYAFRAGMAGATVTAVEIREEQVRQALMVKRAAVELRDLPIQVMHEPVSADSLLFRAGETYDIVLSMGLLYHLNDPIAHIRNLRRLARHAVVIQTLVHATGGPGLWALDVEDPTWITKAVGGISLVPHYRDVPMWLERVGFRDVTVVYERTVEPLQRRLYPERPSSRLARLLTPPAVGSARRRFAMRNVDLRRQANPYYLSYLAFTP